jgi:hypothetical protein
MIRRHRELGRSPGDGDCLSLNHGGRHETQAHQFQNLYGVKRQVVPYTVSAPVFRCDLNKDAQDFNELNH